MNSQRKTGYSLMGDDTGVFSTSVGAKFKLGYMYHPNLKALCKLCFNEC